MLWLWNLEMVAKSFMVSKSIRLENIHFQQRKTIQNILICDLNHGCSSHWKVDAALSVINVIWPKEVLQGFIQRRHGSIRLLLTGQAYRWKVWTQSFSEISQQLNNAKKQLSSQFPGKIVLPFAFFCFFWLGYSLNHNPQNSNVLLVVPQTQLSGLRRARQPPASKTGGSASSSASPAIPVLESLPFGTETFETQVLPSTEMEDLATHLARESQQPEPVVPSAPVVP